ncbi:MAG TPA: ribosome-binding factor A [Candidatus Paceibacterota bacterium]|nr:ribosome-binding factor A [Candidatus Paceibacterota bacterium]
MKRHDERMAEVIAHEAAAFIAREAGTQSLITVTRAVAANDKGDRYSVFVSVFPDDRAKTALEFLSRQREAFSEHLKVHARLHPLPRIEFLIDPGEKNRQRLDEISGGPSGN